MEKKEIVATALAALKEIKPPFPEIGWIPLERIPAFREGADALPKNQRFSFYGEIRKSLDADERLTVGFSGGYRCWQVRQQHGSYPKEINETEYRYLLAACQQLQSEGEANDAGIAKRMSCTALTASQRLKSLSSGNRQFLVLVRPGAYRLNYNPSQLIWIWGRAEKSGRIVNLADELSPTGPDQVATFADKISASVLERAIGVLDRTTKELQQILEETQHKREYLVSLRNQ